MINLFKITYDYNGRYGIEIFNIKWRSSRSLLHIVFDKDDYYLYVGFLFRCFGLQL